MTRSSIGRLIRWAESRGYLTPGDVIGAAAFVRGFQRGRAGR